MMPSSFNHNHALTFVEILLVVIVVAVSALVVMPNFTRSYGGLQLQTVTDDMVSLMRYAQMRAITKARNVRFKFQEDFTSYRLFQSSDDGQGEAASYGIIEGRWGRVFKIPEGVDIKSVYDVIDFYPDGRMTGVSWEVCRQEKCFTISTQQRRGRVRVFETTEF